MPHLTEIHPSKLEVSMLDRFFVSFGVEGGSISLVCTLVVVPDLPNLPPLAQWYRDGKKMMPNCGLFSHVKPSACIRAGQYGENQISRYC